MSRRRYISTDISLDKRVNQLARDGGDFAALLYTWMIPHAEDAARITGDPEELLYTVCPGRRDKTPDDIEVALQDMTDLGLIARDGDTIYFDSGSFYKYQTYVQPKNRADNSEHFKPAAENSGNQRESAENAASLSPSPSLSPPKNLRARRKKKEPVPDYDLVPVTGPITRFVGRARIPEALDESTDLNHALRRYLAAVDACADRNLGDLSAPALEEAKARCRYQALDRLKGQSVNNPAAYLTAAAGNATCLGDLVGDELVEELRRPKKRGKT